MKLTVTSLSLARLEVDLLLVPLAAEDGEGQADMLSDLLGETYQRVIDDFDGDEEAVLSLYPEEAQARRVVLLGMGPRDEVDRDRLRAVGARGADHAAKHEADAIGLYLPETTLSDEVTSEAMVEGFVLGGYRFRQYKKEEKEPYAGPSELELHAKGNDTPTDADCRRGARHGRVVAEAVCSARDLVNRSPNDKTATDLAALIEEAGAEHGYETTIWDEERIREEGMGGLLAVNQGSVEPPTFTVMEYKPGEPENTQPIVLVGKTVTFDTGGLSLKPTKQSMDYMKSDMAGGAAVIGAFEAIAELELPVHVIGLIPATDNRPGQNAYVPGDVVRMHDGTTVEVLNTDAEGRLTLADALSHARTYEPELVVDLATLTGSSVVALGHEAAAVMTPEADGPEDRLRPFQEAGRISGDRVHPLPMYDAYKELLESDVADLKNVGGKPAGAITAGKFLEHFVDFPWVHLDIAGPAFLHEPKPYRPKGGTGYGVRLLAAFFRNYAGR